MKRCDWLARIGYVVAVVAAVWSLPVPVMAGAVVVYENDFDNPGDPLTEWVPARRDVTPGSPTIPSTLFLGPFGSEEVILTLSGLTQGQPAMLAFDFYMINSWDGNEPGNGPDVFTVNVIDGPTFLHTTFHHDNRATNHRQAYPDWYPGGDNLGGSGAEHWMELGYPNDAVYSFPDVDDGHEFVFTPESETVQIRFAASMDGLGISEESWGVDNVVVTTPEPAFGLLLAGVGVCALRRGRQ